jgi:hypothetical protein
MALAKAISRPFYQAEASVKYKQNQWLDRHRLAPFTSY